MGKIVPSQAGEDIVLRVPATVKDACDDKTSGHWYCTTHQKAFANNIQKDIHADQAGTHKLAWFCSFHGVEEPGPQIDD